jgi:hypothetical protein
VFLANSNVEVVTSAQLNAKLIVAIRVVLLLPPSEFYNNLVNGESRYGI